MSLLQELSRDTRTLLNNTHATREQLETFLKVTGMELWQLLYNKENCNLFTDWIETEAKAKNMLFVNIAMIEYLADKCEKDEQYTAGEKLVCYAYDTKANNIVVCSTLHGNYFDYYYNTFKELQEDLY